MEALNWLTVIKWLGAIALAIGIIGTPIVYFNHKVAQAFEQGVVVGKAECEKAQVARVAIELKRKDEIMFVESQKAQTLQAKNEKLTKDSLTLQQRLNDELVKTPEVAGCVFNEHATDLLRSGSRGDFTAVNNAISSDPDGKVPGDAPILREKADHTS